jgi:uncharacterized protein (TIGR02117 family)
MKTSARPEEQKTSVGRRWSARSVMGRVVRWLRIAGLLLLAVLISYLLACLVGLVPVNRDFRDATGGVEVFVYADHVHSEILVPLQAEGFDWRGQFPADDFVSVDPRAEFLAFGWGDRDFYIETPTWSDASPATTLKAVIVPTRTVMHVTYRRRPTTAKNYRRCVLNVEQYAQLRRHIRQTFATDSQGRLLPLPETGYGSQDAFYEARGRYFFLNTCNHWTGRGLKRAGVRTGLWTPFAYGLAQVPGDDTSD